MTIYDLLRRFMPGPQWQDYEVAEAIELIAELERLNVFGTTASAVTEQHKHLPELLRLPGGQSVTRCRLCGKDL
jgi:hypothetical protein